MPDVGRDFETWMGRAAFPAGNDGAVHEKMRFLQRFLGTALPRCLERSFFTTNNGYMGLGPWRVRPGDFVCLLGGGETPFVLRATDGHHELVGEVYVHGIMDGWVLRVATAEDVVVYELR